METILIVDDDPEIVQMLEENFRAEGYDVVSGHDGQMAINLSKKVLPNLIVLDVNMPMMNGIKALQTIRESPSTSGIPVILLTGEVSANVYPQIESQPRVAHVKKPIDPEDLNSLVKEFIRKYPAEKE